MQELDRKEVPVPEPGEVAELTVLVAQHRAFEIRLLELDSKPRLNGQEEVERTDIKKHKLRLKDRMEALRRQSPARLVRS